MEQTPVKRRYLSITRMLSCPIPWKRPALRSPSTWQALLLIFTVILISGSFLSTNKQQDALAQTSIPTGYACKWHQVTAGDTLGGLASYYHVRVTTLIQTNHIYNANLIITGQHLCIPYAIAHRASGPSGLLYNGQVRWYAYNALELSNRSQVVRLLRQAAFNYGIPESLMLAIAWQESGWRQHIIARDGGIGIMQIMPYTAQGLNRQIRQRYDPYKLWDNIQMGALYLHILRRSFGGNINAVISAYNEGGWNVVHRGIFNWSYVRSVRALMYRY